MIYVFHSKWDKKEMDSHTLLNECMEKLWQQKLLLTAETFPDDLELETGEHGKPFFKNYPEIHFSISHTEGAWAVAISDRNVGLDVEYISIKSKEKIAKRFFHAEEIAWLEENGYERFYEVWTKKESYVKYTGDGLSKGMDYYNVFDLKDCVQKDIIFRENVSMTITSENEDEVIIQEF